MYTAYTRMGSLVLDIDGDTLHGTFLRDDGQIDDYFTIVKNRAPGPIASISREQTVSRLARSSIVGRRYQLEYKTSLAEA